MSRARLMFVAVAVLCAAMGIYLMLGRGDEASLERAASLVRAEQHDDALEELDGLSGQTAGRAAALRAYAYVGRRQHELAAVQFSAAARRAPNDWVLQRDYAIVLRKLERRAKARARMRRATALNPRMQLPRGFRSAARERTPRQGR